MEWIETTAKTLDAATELALERLGVAPDEAEFEILDEPRPGLFGRMRGEARVRARVKPTTARPKHDRNRKGRGVGDDRSSKRRGQRSGGGRGGNGGGGQRSGGQRSGGGAQGDDQRHEDASSQESGTDANDARTSGAAEGRGNSSSGGRRRGSRGVRGNGGDERSGATRDGSRSKQGKDQPMDGDEGSTVTPEEVGAAAASFMSGLTEAFGADAETSVDIEGTEIDVRVTGAELGLLVGPGGRTLTAVQDLARVASQRRLGDHDTRLRIDVGGYREKRREALVKFAGAVADQVRESGQPKALEPMSSPDRKVVHDTVVALDGVSSHSEGEDARRRVVITPE